MSGFEDTLKRMGLRPVGGPHALRSPAMRQGAIGASAVQSAQAGAGTPGVPQVSDDPQSQAFSALVKQMLPGMNLPMLNSATPMQGGGPRGRRDYIPPRGVNMLPNEDGSYGEVPGKSPSTKALHRKKAAAALGVSPEQVAAAEQRPSWDTLGNDKIEWSDFAAIGRYMIGGVGKGLSWLGNQLASVLDDSGDKDAVAQAKDRGEAPTAKTIKSSGGAPQMQPGATFGTSATPAPGIPQGEWEQKSPRRR